MKAKENYSGIKGIFKFIANIVSWTALVILILIAIFLAYYTISNRIASQNNTDFDPFISLYTIVSGSMEPNINVYDVVVNKRVDSPNDIKVGDVITFTSTGNLTQGMTITHRVVDIVIEDGKYLYKTKGDNNLTPDTTPADYDYVIGKVILRIPMLGRLQSFIGTQAGWLLIIVIPALFIIISDILKIFKLVGVKNKIVKIEEKGELAKKERAIKEEQRKIDIKKRLNLDKNIDEPDPIKTTREMKIIVADKAPSKKVSSDKIEVLSRTEKNRNNNHQTGNKSSKKKKGTRKNNTKKR